MRVQLVSHASVIVETSDTRIWADPWLISKAFNGSWTLLPAPEFDVSMLEEIDYLWISHEHPDHFNVPTLRSLPSEFKERVTVLFQKNNSRKMFDAFRSLGFPNHRALPHGRVERLTEETEVYCYQVGQADSCLGVRNRGDVVLNLNDALVTRWDCHRMRRALGSPSVVLNQFSIAGYGGMPEPGIHLREMAREHLRMMLENHRDVGAGRTIPFASFIVFSADDNRYVNEFANRPRDVYDTFQKSGEEVAVLYPGEALDTAEPHDSLASLERFDKVYDRLGLFPYDHVDPVPLKEISKAFHLLAEGLRARYPQLLLRRLRPVYAHIPDLDVTVRFSVADATFEPAEPGAAPDLEVNSQPLQFAFQTPFGVQTLGVSARFRLLRNERNWALHRTLFALNNAELYLRPRFLLTRNNLRFLWERRRGLLRQVAVRVAVMGSGR